MPPGFVLIVMAVTLVCGFAGQAIGRPKGYPGAGFAIGLLLGVFGVVIVALMPETEAAKAARLQRQYEAQVAAAYWQYQIQAEAARRAGYPFPPPLPPQPGAWLPQTEAQPTQAAWPPQAEGQPPQAQAWPPQAQAWPAQAEVQPPQAQAWPAQPEAGPAQQDWQVPGT